MRSNLAVDTDTLRQGAAQHRWQLCAARRLAAACRSLLRYASADNRSAHLAEPDAACGFGSRFVPQKIACRQANQAVNRIKFDPALSLPAVASAVLRVSRTAVGLRPLVAEGQAFIVGCPQAQSANAALRGNARGAHNKAVDADGLSARCRWPTVRRSPLRYTSADDRRVLLIASGRGSGSGVRFAPTWMTCLEANQALNRSRCERRVSLTAVARTASNASRTSVSLAPSGSVQRCRGHGRQTQSANAAPWAAANGAHNMAVDTDALRRPAAAQPPASRRSPLR